jgi:thioredoxin reductase (NADPH)
MRFEEDGTKPGAAKAAAAAVSGVSGIRRIHGKDHVSMESIMKHPVMLALDDDANVLAAVSRDLLQRYGDEYRIIHASGGADALSQLRRLRLQGAPVALLLADQRMPGMSGVEFLRSAQQMYPDAKRVLLTAYADTEVAIAAINEIALDHYLLKPWDPAAERLYPVLDDLLDDWRASRSPVAGGVRVVSSRWSAQGHLVRDFLSRNLVSYRWLDMDEDDEAAALLAAVPGGDAAALPLVVFEDGAVLEQPSDAEIAERIGLSTRAQDAMYDVVIIGAGPAGLAAAVHSAAEGYRTLMVERHAPGGQAGLSARIENYLGFPVGLSGADLARRAITQARRFGAEVVSPVEAVGLRLDSGYPLVTLSNGAAVGARALLIASGVQYRRLDVPGCDRLTGSGIYYGGALTEALQVAGRDVHILGGGNAAAQAALHLSRFARSVTLLVRRSELSATMSGYLRQRIDETRSIHVRTDCELRAVAGTDWLEGLELVDATSGRSELVPSFALFVFIGAAAQTDWLDGVIQRDRSGYILSGAQVMRGGRRPVGWTAERDPFLLETNVAGVFVAGDVRHRMAKGVAAAVGEGNMAAQLIHQHLNGLSLREPTPTLAGLATV